MRLVLNGLFVLGLLTAPARAESVDLELVFAADGSGSIDDAELRLQRQGWADALTIPMCSTASRTAPPAPSRSLSWNGAGRARRCSSSTGT